MLRTSQPIQEIGLLAKGQRLKAETSGVEIAIEAHIAGGGQGDVYAVSMGGQRYALKWYRPELVRRDAGLRDRLRRLSRRDPPSPRFLWPIDLVVRADDAGTFGYIMPFRDERFHDFDEVVGGGVRPSLRTIATAALGTVQEYRALHAGGWCYMDINFGNVALDPTTGDVRICDNDNADVNDAPAFVFTGTPGFMAPEIVQRRARPTLATDLWSLAVLLFWAFVRSHPLLGRKEFECQVMDGPAEDRLFGSEATFIFDPTNESNRPVPDYHSNALLLWPIYPAFLRSLFIRAFTDGIRDPRHGRVLETEWRTALVRLRDCIRHCPHCGTENFHDSDSTQGEYCWSPSCRHALPQPMRVKIGDNLIVVDDHAAIFPHHVDAQHRFDFSTAVASFVRHPERPDLVGLRNAGEKALLAKLPDGRERPVGPKQTVELQRGMQISFGAVQAIVD
jgi:DNA-binding helix-hairpin-helix protein with protein kinase domain